MAGPTPTPTPTPNPNPNQVVKVEMAGEEFTASGLMIINMHYLRVYTYEKWSGRKVPYP